MIIVMKRGTTRGEVGTLCDWLNRYPVETSPIFGAEQIVVGLVGDTGSIDIEQVRLQANVDKVMKVSEPYKRANRKFHPENSVVRVGGVSFGGNSVPLIAGPCSVESYEQLDDTAAQVKTGGAALLRGGAFKPRTSPYSFQGLRDHGLEILDNAGEKYGMPVVSEITNYSQIDRFVEHVDLIQVGARNMQNFELLRALGRVRKPVLLKRGFANTVEELLLSAEYIMSGGNDQVILCERGIRTFETQTRNTLDISAVPVLKRLSHLPVVIDPSHAAGVSWLVKPLSLAAVAAGADGLIIEVHNDPAHALSDGLQSLTPEQFSELVGEVSRVTAAIGRTVARPPLSDAKAS